MPNNSGQTSLETLLIVSVVVIGVVAGGYAFLPNFENGVSGLAYRVRLALETGSVAGVGMTDQVDPDDNVRMPQQQQAPTWDHVR